MIKKLISLLLSICVAASCFAGIVFAENENLALGSTVKACYADGSEIEAYSSSYTAAKITDGDASSRFAAKENKDSTGAWFEIDFGKEVTFNKIEVVEYGARIEQWKFQYLDGDTWKDIGQEYRQTGDLSSPNPNSYEAATFPSVKAQKMRLLVTKHFSTNGTSYYGLSIYEMGVYYDASLETQNSYLVNYDANAAEGESGYVAAGSSADYGIKLLNNCWGFANELKLGRKGFRFSPKDVNAGSEEKVYGQFTFANDKKNNPPALDSKTATYAIELEVSSVVRAQGGTDGHYYYTIKGTDENGSACDAVRIHVYGTGTNGKMTVVGADNAKPADVTLDSNGEPAELWYLRIYADMETQAYSVWAVKRGDKDGYTEAEPAEANLLVSGESFKTKIASITGAEFGAMNTYKDKVYVHMLRISETEESVTPVVKSDEELAKEDLDAISLGDMTAVTEDFTLPTAGTVNGSAISWESSNAAIAINGDKAVVTRPAGADASVVLTATATKNEAKPTKTFTVTVKKAEPAGGDVTEVIGTNLALKKTVTAYDKGGKAIEPFNTTTYNYDKMVDGDAETRMAQKDWTDYSGSAIQIDLGKKYRFNTITMKEFAHRMVRYKYQYSNDGKTWTDIGEERRQTGSGDTPNVHADYNFPSVDARYVRIYIVENWNNGGNKVGISIFEMGVYFYPTEVMYAPNAAEGSTGYISGDAAALQKYGVNVAAVSPDRWAGSVKSVETDISGFAGKKGISVEPRNGQSDTAAGAKLLAGSIDFTKNTQSKPLPMNDPSGGYVFDMEFSSYIRIARQTNMPGMWEYQFKGRDADGKEQTFAALRTVLPTDAKAENGALIGYAEMDGAESSAKLPMPLRTSNNTVRAPHVSFMRVYVDLKNQTYSAWLVGRGNLAEAYSEKQPARAELLVRDCPFITPITQLTGVETYSQNTHNDKSFITLLHAYEMDGAVVAKNAADSITSEDILGGNASAGLITEALALPKVYQSANAVWSAEPSGIVSEDGAIIKAPDTDTKVKLTAVFERDGATAQKSFDVTISKNAEVEDDEVKVRMDYEALSLGDTSAVTGNMNLPTVGSKRGSSIVWSSSDSSVINPKTGEVNRPAKGAAVTLTATITFGNAKKEKTFDVTVLGTLASVTIAGVDGTYFEGGVFYKTEQMNFVDYFEGDGSNGTNGTIPWEQNGEVEGLKAEKSGTGIRFSKAGPVGSNPGRGATILEQTYKLPQPEDLKKAYYMELECELNAGGQVLLDFGSNGDASVLRINKTDGGNGATQQYQYETEETVRATGTYSAKQNVRFGIYIMPELKEMVIYQNGKKAAEKIYGYSDPSKALDSLKIVWKQNLQWYNIPAAEYVWIKTFNMYEGDGISAENAIALDKEALTLKAITSQKAGEITGDLKLYTKGKFNSEITWKSSAPDVIDPETGRVTRPEADTAVKLTATLRNGDKTETVEFDLVVQRKMTVDNILTGSSVKIENGSSIESLSNLTDGNYNTYIETLDAGKKPIITVNMGQEKAISTVVINGLQGAARTVVEVSADGKTWQEVGTVTGSGEQMNISFLPVMAKYIRLSVKEMEKEQTIRISELEAAMDADDSDIVEADAKLVKAFDGYNVSAGAKLPSKGVFGSSITWKSSEPKVVSDNGEFTKPNVNTPFTMTATLTYGTATKTSTESHMAIGGSPSKPSGGGGGGGALRGSGAIVSLTEKTDGSGETSTGNPQADTMFKDVAQNHWAYEYIRALKDAGVVSGDENGMFRPADSVTREEYLKLLIEALGFKTDYTAAAGFDDVADGDWFAPYVNTAAEIGLVKGVSPTSFGVGQSITRQDMAVMTKRAIDIKGMTLDGGKKAEFADAAQIAEYARESVEALSAAGVLNGDENGLFNPGETARREQAAKIIFMVMQGYQK